MLILIIPDVHLKPDIFLRADYILRSGQAEMAVCLGDLVDDYPKADENDLQPADAFIDINVTAEHIYDTFDVFEDFSDHHKLLYCWGDHDAAYFWDKPMNIKTESMQSEICKSFNQIIDKSPEGRFAFMHRIDNILFSHAGLAMDFITGTLKMRGRRLEDIMSKVNEGDPEKLWNPMSPLLLRPQWNGDEMYSANKIMQVFGHTPTADIWTYKNCLSADVFTKAPFQLQESCGKFVILDSHTGNYTYAAG